MIQGIWVKRGEVQFGPLAPDEVRSYVGEGRILPGDLGRFEGHEAWMPVEEVVRRMADEAPACHPPSGGTSGAKAREAPGPQMATPAQLTRLRAMGMVADGAQITREMAVALIERAEERHPAGRGLLSKLERFGVSFERGITIGEAKRRLRPVLLRHHLEVLAEKNIPHTPDITFEDAEGLAETGPATTDQIKEAIEMGLRLPPNVSQRKADWLLQEIRAEEARTVSRFIAVATSNAGIGTVDRLQVRNVVRYLNRHFRGWEQDQPERRFFGCLAKFYPHLIPDASRGPAGMQGAS